MKEKLYSWLRQITLKQIRGFEAVVNAGSVSSAARELHLTPPAVSLQLRDLENTIGLPLLERSDSGLVPTLAGQELFALSQEFQSILSRFGETVTELKGIDHGVVSVGVVSTARYFAPMVLAEFMRIYQDIKIQLQVGNRATIMQKLESLELDFAITGLPPEHFKVKKEFISNHPQIIIAAPDHPLAKSTRISLSELTEETFLLREAGSGTRSVTDMLFARRKDLPKSGLEFGSNETIKQAVMAGMGIALISAHTVAAELKEKRLIALDVKGTPINRKWFVVKHANKRFLSSAQALWKFVARNGKHYLPKP
ncbi:MAG: RuBisCO operon transcriptional regulator CbbR [Olavius algarvensis Gamma 3 endosymbiont]|nr:MAG: RuBisCO operon transcriptional regulator CbbR [Olavius algarvensis Gamma 3 endosymbiont]